MTCHSCPHAEDILRGDYDSTPWDEMPCADCTLYAVSKRFIPLDEENPPPEAVYTFHGEELDEPEEVEEPLMLPADAIEQFLRRFYFLPPEQRDVISWRYQGLQYKEIAARQGVTVSCVEKRHRLAMRDFPALKELFPRKVARQKVRRPHTRRQKSCQ
jgi:DNA-directed RNA polymerase specialized sigma24 family protein